jgi:anaerobic ribonucleoside-triphosphate reductase activating protein
MFGGREFTNEDIEDIIQYLNNEYVSGITFSGGHPLEWYNIDYVICTIQEIRKRCPNKTIWLYTGWVLENTDIFDPTNNIAQCVSICDVVVDGPYIEEQRNISLPYCGSNNQRVIDIQKTLENKRITLYEE